MRRIFIAINLPEETKTALEKLAREIASSFPHESDGGVVRWLKKDNLHITLLFIGSVRDEEIPKICEIVKNIAQDQKPFSLRFEKVCYGPPRKIPPRLIWLDIERGPEAVQLADELKKEMAEAGILGKIEKRAFSPHITLGRIRTWQWQQIEPEERPDIDKEISLEFEVKSIEVMESKLRRTGAEYSVLESVKLV